MYWEFTHPFVTDKYLQYHGTASQHCSITKTKSGAQVERNAVTKPHIGYSRLLFVRGLACMVDSPVERRLGASRSFSLQWGHAVSADIVCECWPNSINMLNVGKRFVYVFKQYPIVSSVGSYTQIVQLRERVFLYQEIHKSNVFFRRII